MKGNAILQKIVIGLTLLSIITAQGTAQGQTGLSSVSSTLCSIIGMVKSIATVLAVAMFVIGGILYAIGNLLTGGMKQSAHGWAQGLILGGAVAVVLVIIAQPIVNLIASVGGLPSVNC